MDFFWEENQKNIYLSQIAHQRQIKKTIRLKSSLVKQCV